MLKKYLETGKIVGTHGIKGELRVQPWCDTGDFLKQFKYIYTDDKGTGKIKVKYVKLHGNIVIMCLEGINSIEEAEKLRNKIIYIDRNDVKLPEGRYFIDDLLGCTVTHVDSGKELGKITDISETGANDVWHITNQQGEYLVPAIDEVIVSVDVKNKAVVIKPLKGIFENED